VETRSKSKARQITGPAVQFTVTVTLRWPPALHPGPGP
jgi:hypothetical protein